MTEEKHPLKIPGLEGVMGKSEGLFNGTCENIFWSSLGTKRQGEHYLITYTPRMPFSYDIIEEVGEAFVEARVHKSRPLLVVKKTPHSEGLLINENLYVIDLGEERGARDTLRTYLLHFEHIPQESRIHDDKLHVFSKELERLAGNYQKSLEELMAIHHSSLTDEISRRKK